MSLGISDLHNQDNVAGAGVAPGILAARRAFRADLPRLMAEHDGEWVAYHCETCLGFSNSQRELYRLCMENGLNLNEVLVCSVEPDEPIVVEDLIDR